jgi:hypothetical protein
MLAAIHDFVTARRGFYTLVTAVLATLWLLRSFLYDGPVNSDVPEQLDYIKSWRLSYVSGANPPLFTWVAKLAADVTGAPILAIEFVRFAAFWLFIVFSYQCARQVLEDERMAALAGLAPFAMYMVGWESIFRHTNTMMLMASVPLTHYALIRLDRRPVLSSYLFFGLVTAFGFLSKYNYAFVWTAFLAAAFADRRLRGRLLDARMLLAIGLALALMAPVLAWLVDHFAATMQHSSLRMKAPVHYPGLPVVVSAFADLGVATLGLLVPFLPIVALLAPGGFRRLGRKLAGEAARHHRFLAVYLSVLFLLMAGGIVAFEVTRVYERYLYVVVPYGLLVFLRIAAAAPNPRRRQWLALVLAAMALALVAGTIIRYVSYPWRGKPYGRIMSSADGLPAGGAAQPFHPLQMTGPVPASNRVIYRARS